MGRFACLLILMLFSISKSHAFEVGDLESGATLVRETCSRCHAVRKGELLSPNRMAPTFVKVATTPGMTAAALTVTLTTPHAGMPMFRLKPEQRRDIIAYILSLKSEK
jgi:mono/diheme cytochrome c family protein